LPGLLFGGGQLADFAGATQVGIGATGGTTASNGSSEPSIPAGNTSGSTVAEILTILR
jgi:hypothetical protein